ncbi:MAG: hypothetical protein HYS27_27240 [Deltaproteobacteria bacterium]|nr:hypothetical protein [Deltaproteobacteria bacterium]
MSRAPLLALLVLALASLAWLLGLVDVGLVLTNDGPSHLLQCRVFASIDEPGSRYAGLFTANVPVTARGACELQLVLERLLSWRAVHQVLFGLPSVLFALAAWLAGRAIHPLRAWMAVGVAALPAHTLLYYGFFPYALGAGVAAIGVALAVAEAARGRQQGWRAPLAFGSLLVLCALCHAVAAFAYALLVGAVLLATAGDRRALGRALLRHVACGAPALVVLVRALTYAVDNEGSTAPAWLPFALHLRVLFAWAQAGGTAREVVAVLVPLVGCALTVARWRAALVGERAVAAVALAALALFWLLPQDALGFLIFSPRVLVFFVVFGVVTMPIERWPRLPNLLPPLALGALLAVQLAWLQRFHEERARAADAALAFLDAPLQGPGVRLPVPLDPYLGRANGEAWGVFGWVPGLHAAQLYGLSQGGAVEYSQDQRRATQWALRTPASLRGAAPDLLRYFPRLPTTEARAARALAAARAGTRWDGVVVLGDDDEQAAFVRVGYRAEFRNQAVLLARFAGCPLEVVVVGSPIDAPLTLTVRAAGDVEPWLSATVTRGAADAEPQFHFGGAGDDAGPPAPCGPVIVEAAAPFTCEGAPLAAELPRQSSVTCAVRAH